MLTVNLEWLGRLMLDQKPIQLTFISDSTGTTGANSNHFPYFTGIVNEFRPKHGICGFQMPAVESADIAPYGCFHTQNNSGATSVVAIKPGQETPDGNFGLHLGGEFWYRGNYATARADGGVMRTHTLKPTSWFDSQPKWFESGREVKARQFFLKTTAGPTNIKVRGLRGSTVIEEKVVDLSGDETAIAVDVSCGSGNGEVGCVIVGGGGSEVDKIAIHGQCYFYVPNGSGMIFDSFAKGGWGSNHWSTEAGAAINDGTSYTAKVLDAALAQMCQISYIEGATRVFWLMIGQNDGGLTQAQHRANLVLIVARLRAANPGCHIVIASPPDPAATPGTRFAGFDDNAISVARQLDTPSSRVAGIATNAILRPSRCVQGQFGAVAIFDTVHATLAGSSAVAREWWRAITSEVARTVGRTTARQLNPDLPSAT